ncbi:MAG TPA: type II CAAX endopeptidase family protein [Thermoanaerobaculia bacterium]|jgi:membrane protease YdiL (CAAX protease family)|nr:type II CAAX endopeptidase family protein [Thermoanaerobaculia bacterium]
MGRSAPLKFFFITFAITWPCFSAVAAFSAGAAPNLAMLRGPILFLGIFAPSIVALSLTARARGTGGVLALLRRLVQADVGARWYFFAIGYMVSVKLIVALLHRIFLGAWPRFGGEAWYVMLAATIGSTIIGGQAGEEIGWRGFALPRLASRFGYGAGSIILGVIWALWHLPLFFVREADTYGQSFLLYTLQVTAISVAIAFLYQRTNGSLLLTMLMHSAINQTKDIVPSQLDGATNSFTFSASVVGWLTVGVLWSGAGYFLFRMRRSAQGRSDAIEPHALNEIEDGQRAEEVVGDISHATP